MAIRKADVIDAMGELVDALVKYADRNGDREIELVVGADGTCTLMGSMDYEPRPATGFEAIQEFESFPELWAYLAFGG